MVKHQNPTYQIFSILNDVLCRPTVQKDLVLNIKSRYESQGVSVGLVPIPLPGWLYIQFPEPKLARDVLGIIDLINDGVHSRDGAISVQDKDVSLGDGGNLEGDLLRDIRG